MRLCVFFSCFMLASAIKPGIEFNQFGLSVLAILFLLFDIMDFGGRRN